MANGKYDFLANLSCHEIILKIKRAHFFYEVSFLFDKQVKKFL